MTSKQRVIMHRGVHTSAWVRFQEDYTDLGHRRNVLINWDDWADMGSPEVITVTIEPGDLLNDDPISR